MRAQFEAMGLAIIVVLISFGFLLFLYFGSAEQDDTTGQYRNEQLAQNVVDAMLATQIRGCALDVADVIEDAYFYMRNPCVVEGMQTSQEIAEQAMGVMLDETLSKRGYRYNFQIIDENAPEEDRMKFEYPPNDVDHKAFYCAVDGEQETDRPGMQPITLYPSGQTILVVLYICT